MILSSWGISLSRHQCAIHVYMRCGEYNLFCHNVYSHISDILHNSFSSLCCSQIVLLSYLLYLPIYVSGCSHSNGYTLIFLLVVTHTLGSISLFRPSLLLYCRNNSVYRPCLISYDFFS